MKVPVLILAFNRPEHVRKALEPICEYQPDRLYLTCDGPRLDKDGENLVVAETQKSMQDAVNWSCKVKTLFREKNLGCAKAVFDAVSWFFEQEEYGIIVEDDVVLSSDFFTLCEILLPHYKDNPKVMHIAAHNPCATLKESNEYSFLNVIRVWGWASWRRAWKMMDFEMKNWKRTNKWRIIKTFGLFHGIIRWQLAWGKTYRNIDRSTSWATRWYFSCFYHRGVALCSKVNLAENIGMSSGTHFEKTVDSIYEFEIGKVIFPLRIETRIVIDPVLDRLERRDFIRLKENAMKRKMKRLWNH